MPGRMRTVTRTRAGASNHGRHGGAVIRAVRFSGTLGDALAILATLHSMRPGPSCQIRPHTHKGAQRFKPTPISPKKTPAKERKKGAPFSQFRGNDAPRIPLPLPTRAQNIAHFSAGRTADLACLGCRLCPGDFSSSFASFTDVTKRRNN